MDTLAWIGNGGVGIVKGGVGVTRGGVGLKPPLQYEFCNSLFHPHSLPNSHLLLIHHYSFIPPEDLPSSKLSLRVPFWRHELKNTARLQKGPWPLWAVITSTISPESTHHDHPMVPAEEGAGENNTNIFQVCSSAHIHRPRPRPTRRLPLLLLLPLPLPLSDLRG